MFKINNKDNRTRPVLVSLLLTLNIRRAERLEEAATEGVL